MLELHMERMLHRKKSSYLNPFRIIFVNSMGHMCPCGPETLRKNEIVVATIFLTTL